MVFNSLQLHSPFFQSSLDHGYITLQCCFITALFQFLALLSPPSPPSHHVQSSLLPLVSSKKSDILPQPIHFIPTHLPFNSITFPSLLPSDKSEKSHIEFENPFWFIHELTWILCSLKQTAYGLSYTAHLLELFNTGRPHCQN